MSNISKFKTLTIFGSSFPEKVYKIKANSTKKITRAEVKMRKLLLKRSKEIARIPSFGDYGIVFPIPLIFDKLTNFGGKIRYTDVHDFVILRGQNFKKHSRGRQQYYDLSQKLIKMEEYKGQEYSWGDAQYERYASKKFIGSLTKWIEIDTTHHLTFVANQISNSS